MAYQHGIDRVEQADALLCGKRVGLITNYTGLNLKFERTVDILKIRYGLQKLYAPEHGLDGIMQAGVDIDHITDDTTGLPVWPLFGKNRVPDFSDLDVLVYDIQDIGLRFFTHISILAKVMKECRKSALPLVIFDRYNPLGLNKVSGTVLKEEFSSFLGRYPIPSRYGLTVGEYARYINSEQGIGCDLQVISCRDLKRSDDFKTLGLQWIAPSPNLPTYRSALVYTGTVVFEGTNISEGRGTTQPFEFIGAPWIREKELAAQMNAIKLPGVFFQPIRFMPVFSKYKGECCCGIQLHITDEEAFEPFICGLSLLDTVRKTYREFECTDFLYKLLGTNEFTAKAFNLETFIQKHRQQCAEFTQKAEKYYLYF